VIALDASVIIAHLSTRDAHHKRATDFFRATVDESYLMHSLTFTEVLIGPMRAGREALAIQALNDLRVNEWSPGPRSAARLAKLRVESGLKLPDCCVLDTALENDASLATFNARLSTVATEFGVHVL